MATKIGEFREVLIEAIDAVRKRDIDAEEAVAISKLAAQVNLSLQTEINGRKAQVTMHEDGSAVPFGDLSLGVEEYVAKLEHKK